MMQALRAHLPIPQRPFEREVIFCVRGVVSAPLANVYLHYIIDLWVEVWRKKIARGDVIIVRYADDLVAGFVNYVVALF